MADKQNVDTKQAVLMAASKVFAERGYQQATIREIAQKARANVAAVNYHYGDKERLYLEVMRYWANQVFSEYPMEKLQDRSIAPEERLYTFIYHTLLCVLGHDGRGTGFGRLITMEASFSPSEHIRQVVSESIGSPTHALCDVVRELLGKDVIDETVRYYSASTVAQTIYFYSSRFLLRELFEIDPVSSIEQIEKLAAHIRDFSLKAMKVN